MVNIINLWLFYIAGYAITYPLWLWADRKRRKPFEDPELLAQKKLWFQL